ncbi:MAG: DUF4258 domain-containing protein [Aquificaceae bacterium]
MEVRVNLTQHFKDKWEERKTFMESQIVEYVVNPDLVLDDPDFPNRKWHLKRVGERCLKVVVEQEGNKLILITAYFDRTLRRKGLCG